MAAFADYLGLDTAWLRRRCAELAREGCGGLVRPRSRLLTVAGMDAACARVGGSSASARFVSPAMRRQRNPDLYDVPLLAFDG